MQNTEFGKFIQLGLECVFVYCLQCNWKKLILNICVWKLQLLKQQWNFNSRYTLLTLPVVCLWNSFRRANIPHANIRLMLWWCSWTAGSSPSSPSSPSPLLRDWYSKGLLVLLSPHFFSSPSFFLLSNITDSGRWEVGRAPRCGADITAADVRTVDLCAILIRSRCADATVTAI